MLNTCIENQPSPSARMLGTSPVNLVIIHQLWICASTTVQEVQYPGRILGRYNFERWKWHNPNGFNNYAKNVEVCLPVHYNCCIMEGNN